MFDKLISALLKRKSSDDYIWQELSVMPGFLIVLTDASFVLTWANDFFYDFFECRPDDIVGQPMHGFLGEDIAGDMSEKHIALLLDKGLKWDHVAGTASASGEYINIRWNQKVFTDGQGVKKILSLGIPLSNEKDNEKARLYDEDREKMTQGFARPYLYTESEINLEDEAEIKALISKKNFVTHYQPRVNARTKVIVGCEALVRINHPEKGLIYPNAFLPVAERTEQIFDIGTFVIETACKKIREWQNDSYLKNLQSVSLNISPKQICDDKFVQTLLSNVTKNQIDPSKILLELAERAICENFDEICWAVRTLKDSGFKVAIDDYTAKFVSIPLLLNLAVDNISIDKRYLLQAEKNPNIYPVMESIIVFAHGLNMTVTVGGIENRRQLDFLLSNAVDFLQGYLISEPLEEAEFDRFIKNNPDFYSRHI